MSLYRRGGIWWHRFKFQGVTVRESSGLTNKEAARAVEDKRHTQLRESRAGYTRRSRAPVFSMAADMYLKAKRADWAPKTSVIEANNLAHLEPCFGNRLLSDIGHEDVAAYREQRLGDGAAEKTVSLEIGTIRGIKLHFDLDSTWRNIKKKIKLKKARKVGRAITMDEQTALLMECRRSRSRSLPVAVTLAIEACLRYSEIRLLRWRQIDFGRRVVTVGESKTEAGEGRSVPLSKQSYEALCLWAALFPSRKLNHYVFPSERYGQGGKVYDTDVSKPITTWKEAWEHGKARAGVTCRFHDLRHTGCTRLLDSGVSHPVVAEIMGWSASTAIRMIKEVYGHTNLATRQRAMEQVEQFMAAQKIQNIQEGAQKWAQSEESQIVAVQ
jgi:integrase